MEYSSPAATPPIANTNRCSVDDVYDESSYFLQPYVPLSSLPTPPLSSHSEGSSGEDPSKFSVDAGFNSTLLGPAILLKNLIPSSASLIDPSVQIVHSILARAELPLPTIALAVCILDSLNSRFARLWRCSCPLHGPDRHVPKQAHIDSIRPEVIILAALIISVKFLDDEESPTKAYCADWGSGRWTCEQINVTQQCIMENLGYRILPLWKKDLIDGALEDMETAGRYASGFINNNPSQRIETKSAVMNSVKEGMLAGNELTPALTPLLEYVHETMDIPSESKRTYDLNDENDFPQLPTPESLDMEFIPIPSELVPASSLGV